MQKTYYDILSVAPKAPEAVIKAAYRTLAAQYHPDKYSGPKDEANRLMSQINEAYETLSNRGKRIAYDARLKRQRDELNAYSRAQSSDEDKKWHASSDIEKVIRKMFDLTGSITKEKISSIFRYASAIVAAVLTLKLLLSFLAFLYSRDERSVDSLATNSAIFFLLIIVPSVIFLGAPYAYRNRKEILEFNWGLLAYSSIKWIIICTFLGSYGYKLYREKTEGIQIFSLQEAIAPIFENIGGQNINSEKAEKDFSKIRLKHYLDQETRFSVWDKKISIAYFKDQPTKKQINIKKELLELARLEINPILNDDLISPMEKARAYKIFEIKKQHINALVSSTP